MFEGELWRVVDTVVCRVDAVRERCQRTRYEVKLECRRAREINLRFFSREGLEPSCEEEANVLVVRVLEGAFDREGGGNADLGPRSLFSQVSSVLRREEATNVIGARVAALCISPSNLSCRQQGIRIDDSKRAEEALTIRLNKLANELRELGVDKVRDDAKRRLGASLDPARLEDQRKLRHENEGCVPGSHVHLQHGTNNRPLPRILLRHSLRSHFAHPSASPPTRREKGLTKTSLLGRVEVELDRVRGGNKGCIDERGEGCDASRRSRAVVVRARSSEKREEIGRVLVGACDRR